MSSPADPLIGATVSQYEIVAKLGGGGMGVVYRARDLRLGRHVALKFLPPQWSHDDTAKQRFMREAQAASATQHKNICTIHNIEETADGRLFIVMAYYEGETLKQMLERGPLPMADAVDIAAGIAEGLAKAHAQGVVHRDVKPGNIIVTDEGPKILDFGLAKFADALQLTVPGSTIGTVAYMSPEQARGEEADARSDVWALGVVLFEMLTGRVPFRGAYPEATFYAIKHEPVPVLTSLRDDVPPALDRIVTRALEKDPAARFQTAREPARELRLLQGRTMPLDLRTEEVPMPVLKRPAPRRRRRTGVASLALLALLAATAVYWWMHRPIDRVAIAIVPVANHTGLPDLDASRMALTAALMDDLSRSSRVRVVPYLRLLEIVRPFILRGNDISSSDAVQAIATTSGAPLLVVPTLVYRDREASWLMEVQIRNASTGTTVAQYETAPVNSSLSQQTAFRLAGAAAEQVDHHFGERATTRATGRLRDGAAAMAFARAMDAYEQLEYQQAKTALVDATNIDPQNPSLFGWLSRVQGLLGQRTEAVAAARRARSLTGDSSAAEQHWVDAVLDESLGDLDAAEQSYRRAADTSPDDVAWRVEVADFLKRRQDRNQPAIDAFQALARSDAGYIRLHVDLCQLYTRLNDYPLADKEGAIAAERARANGNDSIAAQALLCEAESARRSRGDLTQARKNAAAAREIVTRLDQRFNLARAIFYQGLIEFSAGRMTAARDFFAAAATQLADTGNRVTEALALMNLGVINFYAGRPSEALTYYERSGKAFHDIGDERRAAEMDVNLSGLQLDYGLDRETALRTLRNARANLERLGHVDFELGARNNEALAARYAGDNDRARQLQHAALAEARDKKLTARIASLRAGLARVDLETGNYGAALETEQALVAEHPSDAEERAFLALTLMRLGDFATAATEIERASRDADAAASSGLTPLLESARGELEMLQGHDRPAREHFEKAAAAWTDPLPNPFVTEASCSRAVLEARDGEIERARRTIATADKDAAVLNRVRLVAFCAASRARVELAARAPRAAEAALAGIPDASEARLGRALFADVEWVRARSGAERDPAGAATHAANARTAVAAIAETLPDVYKSQYRSRRDIGDMFAPAQ